MAVFMVSVKKANRFKRQNLLQHANADQVNAVSELVLNLFKKQHSRHTPHHGTASSL